MTAENPGHGGADDALVGEALRLGIQPEHVDAFGKHVAVSAETLRYLVGVIGRNEGGEAVADASEPQPAFQGKPNLPERFWALAIQLYGVRSARNWGHGDFTDLADIVEIAAQLGASGLGLNPLHALFGDRPNEPSPYAPSSRRWLNPLYADLDALPEFPGIKAAGLTRIIERARQAALVDYPGVAEAKRVGFEFAYRNFMASGATDRRARFEVFRLRQGEALARYATFEVLRRRYRTPFWEWPAPWRHPDDETLAGLADTDADALGLVAYEQWVCDDQLRGCNRRAEELGMALGLYLDIAVGVRPDGFDAWDGQGAMLSDVSVGAPPDLLNTAGQKWGLVSFNPASLASGELLPFREMLAANMRHAGAVRLDHVLGLKRLYLVPEPASPAQGAYVRMPFEALLAAAAEESREHGSILIGEDLGTVPDGFRQTLGDWGIWTYQVALFARDRDGAFIDPAAYPRNALATFATHDLPSLSGWLSTHDLAVKRRLGIDPGETDSERREARGALRRAVGVERWGANPFDQVLGWLSTARSRLLVVAVEDVMELNDQVNVPGTIDQHPNWRRRLPLALEDWAADRRFRRLASILAARARRR